jgi:hypothetical protein
MTTRIFTVAAGQTGTFPAPVTSSVLVQPGASGTASISYGPLATGSFILAPQGSNTTPYSLCTSNYSGQFTGNNPGMGNVGFVQVAATTAAANVLVSDLSQYPGSFPERLTVFQSAVAMTSIPSSTAENTLASIRFPINFLQPNFWMEIYFGLTLTNNANVKTLKMYFGPSTNSATNAAIETSAAAFFSNVYTSMIGANGHTALGGRNDGQTVICANPGLLSTGGWGSSTTANTTVSTANYNAGGSGVEQVLAITGTKATGTDTFTLDYLVVHVTQ